jgi:hypothetical protein
MIGGTMNPTRCAMVALVAVAAVLATPRLCFGQLTAVSTNGRYRVDAVSPELTSPDVGYLYTLTDQTNKQVVWERRQPMVRQKGNGTAVESEPRPRRLFVADDGSVLALVGAGIGAEESMIGLDSRDGSVRGTVPIVEAFPKGQLDTFAPILKTSSYWETSVAEYFVTLNEAKPDEAVTYFVVRPFWGHRLVIDLDTMTHVYLGAFHGAVPRSKLTHADEATRRIVLACIAEETRSALEVLTKASTVEPPDLRHYRLELESAMRTVVLFQLTEAGPLLAEIELRMQAMTFPWWRLEPKLHQAIRAAGKSPRPYRGEELPRYTILPASADQAPKPVENVLLSAEVRVANAAAIKPGMTVPRMVELIGLPDFRIDTVEHGKMCDYDIDGPSPHTLRVTFSEFSGAINSVEVITPYAFLTDPVRIRGW